MGKDIRVSQCSDSVMRALTDDGAFRVITARTTNTVRQAIEAQKVVGPIAAHFADLITGTILVRETMSPQLRVQGIIRGAGNQGSLVADSHPGGANRGLVQLSSDQELRVAGGLLQMVRTLHDGRIQQGIVDIPSSGGISAGLMRYMQISEQITSVIAVGTVVLGDQIVESGGYIVQLLPEVGEGQLMLMTARLEDFDAIESILGAPNFAPGTLLEELLYGMPYTPTEQSELRFECNCSELRVLAGLATLQGDALQSLVNEGGALEIRCDFCGAQYKITTEQLLGLISPN